jgi:hypothetical protein
LGTGPGEPTATPCCCRYAKARAGCRAHSPSPADDACLRQAPTHLARDTRVRARSLPAPGVAAPAQQAAGGAAGMVGVAARICRVARSRATPALAARASGSRSACPGVWPRAIKHPDRLVDKRHSRHRSRRRARPRRPDADPTARRSCPARSTRPGPRPDRRRLPPDPYTRSPRLLPRPERQQPQAAARSTATPEPARVQLQPALLR